jgi:hypothetical protein
MDFQVEPSCAMTCLVVGLLLIGAFAVGWTLHSWLYGLAAGLVALFLGGHATTAVQWLLLRVMGSVENRAWRRIRKFVADHPDWHFRVYRTPAGLRVLAVHQTFDPHAPAVKECFKALGTDTKYARMCLNQRCFRARVSPKPWRIGINAHIRPRPGVWPVNPDRLHQRSAWIADYEQAARDYASCRFIEALGSGIVNPTAHAIQLVHDQLCQVGSDLPIA